MAPYRKGLSIWQFCILTLGVAACMVSAVNQPQGEMRDTEGNILRRSDLVADAEHIRKHLSEEAKLDPNGVTEDELVFHYFKGHDTNGDNLLDGLELMAALAHNTERQLDAMNMRANSEAEKQSTMAMVHRTLVASVDRVLEDDDKDNDGYLSYVEFQVSRRAGKLLQKG